MSESSTLSATEEKKEQTECVSVTRTAQAISPQHASRTDAARHNQHPTAPVRLCLLKPLSTIPLTTPFPPPNHLYSHTKQANVCGGSVDMCCAAPRTVVWWNTSRAHMCGPCAACYPICMVCGFFGRIASGRATTTALFRVCPPRLPWIRNAIGI